jgi:hypothetical protein
LIQRYFEDEFYWRKIISKFLIQEELQSFKIVSRFFINTTRFSEILPK